MATAVWLVASAAFSIYTANFASYNETYGSLGAVVVGLCSGFLDEGLCGICMADGFTVGIGVRDEIERGLEPYRQRVLIGKLQSAKSQAFVTTHSPAAISATMTGTLWYVGHDGKVGPLDAKKISDALAKAGF